MAGKWTNDSTLVSAAELDQLVVGDSAALPMRIMGFRFYYNGAAWVIQANCGSVSEYSDVAVAWDGVADELDIDLSGVTFPFATNLPVTVVGASRVAGGTGDDANFTPQAYATSATDVSVRFYDEVTGAHITTEATQMDCQMILFGQFAA